MRFRLMPVVRFATISFSLDRKIVPSTLSVSPVRNVMVTESNWCGDDNASPCLGHLRDVKLVIVYP
jgi:hypothetical protein